MQEWLKVITREDIYSIIIPIVTAVLGWGLSQITILIEREKQWKQLREKSSCDRYCLYFVVTVLFGLLWFALYLFMIGPSASLLAIPISEKYIKISYSIFMAAPYTYFLFGIKHSENLVVFKRTYKHVEVITWIVQKVPFICSGIIWSSLMWNNTESICRICGTILIILEVFCLITLKNVGEFECKYATFYFYEEKVIDSIEIQSISQKGNWIIAKDTENGMEHRFRIKDIKRVEYRNER